MCTDPEHAGSLDSNVQNWLRLDELDAIIQLWQKFGAWRVETLVIDAFMTVSDMEHLIISSQQAHSVGIINMTLTLSLYFNILILPAVS